MSLRTDTFDLGGLRLSSGEGRRLELNVAIDPFSFGGEAYPVEPALVPARLDISRTTGDGYVLRLRFEATLVGPCMRCLDPASPTFDVDAREVSQAGETDDLSSPYVQDGVVDLRSWARDALALVLPTTLLCRADCAGLCAECGANLNEAGQDHSHERAPDPRWAKLSQIHFE
ncbi:MAG: YceD family protein [Solirubrobacteraceae bacterium]